MKTSVLESEVGNTVSAIVTKASSTKAVVITRALGKHGIEITTCDKKSFSAAFYSKYSSNNFLYPSPQDLPEEFINSLVAVVRKGKYDVLIPVHSEETYVIAKYKNRLEPHIKVPLHDHKTIMAVNDKGYLAKICQELSLPVPNTYFPDEVRDIEKIGKKVEYPAVIKLRDTTSSIGLSYVHSKEELKEKYKETVSRFGLKRGNYPVVQEYVPGDGYGVSALYNHGDLRAIFTHRRLREYPVTGGPSTVRESVRHPGMEKIAKKLLTHLNWHGVAMVEFKLNEKTKKPAIIELNPRFWGSVNQAISSGVDFPYLLYQMARNGDVKPVTDYMVGIKTRFLLDDLRALPSYMKSSGKSPDPLKDFFRFRGYKYDDISAKDPLPFIVLAVGGLRGSLKSDGH